MQQKTKTMQTLILPDGGKRPQARYAPGEQGPVSIIGRQAEPTCSDSGPVTVESRTVVR